MFLSAFVLLCNLCWRLFLLAAIGQIFIERPAVTVKVFFWNLNCAESFAFYIFTDDIYITDTQAGCL